MPSRDMRRATRRHKQQDGNIAQKRRTSQPFLYAFSVVILIVIVVTFVGGPVMSRSGGGSRFIFGYYKGIPIEFFPDNYFSQRKDAIADQLRESGGQEDLAVQAYQVWRTAFDQTILHTAILSAAEESDLWISEDRVNEALITAGPYSRDGKFSEERYNATPNAQKLTYKKLYREQLTHEQYIEDTFRGLHESPLEKQFLADMVQQQRRFSLVSFPFSTYPEEQIDTYAEQNKERFRRIKLSRILIKSSEREAKEIRTKLIDRTGSFEELARAHSKDVYAEKGGDMGWRYYYDLEADYEDKEAVEAIFQLEETAISQVLESRFGWTIFRCDTPALEPDFAVEETRQVVTDYVMRYEKGIVEDYTLSQAESFRERVDDVGFLGATLEGNYSVGLTDYFPVNYQSYYFLAPVRSPIEQINLSSAAYSEEFFIQAFSLTPGQVSTPILLDDQVIVLRLDDIRQAPEREMELLDDYATYYAQQSTEQDLQNALLNEDFIQDDFDAAFYQYVFPRQ